MPQLGSAVKWGRDVSGVFFQSGGLSSGSLSKSCSTSRETQINNIFQATNSRAAARLWGKQFPHWQKQRPKAGIELARYSM
jgi:hypothetical protein